MNQRELFQKYLAQTSPEPLSLEIERAEGVYLFDNHNKSYIDLISGISVSNVGHRHPRVIKAIQDQLDKYLHLMVYGEYIQSPQNILAQKLASTLPENLDNVYFVNSGSEAIEGAMKLAKRYTGRKEFISCFKAYHGSSHGALSLGSEEIFKEKFRPLLPGIKNIKFGCIEDLPLISEQTAAIVLETVQGEAGIQVADDVYFQELRKQCDRTGTLLILDEIQAGFGRTGKFWAFQHYDIVPDILVTAKGMGGGMPIGAFISSKKIMQTLMVDPILGHITTFGGHPVCCAASAATIDILLEENLINQVASKALLFRKLLKHPDIIEIRNKGLLMAVQFSSFQYLKKIIDQTISNGVITDWFLFCDDSMRIAPPLTISNEEIEKVCNIIIKSINEIQ